VACRSRNSRSTRPVVPRKNSPPHHLPRSHRGHLEEEEEEEEEAREDDVVINATRPGPACLQASDGQEDCLYLNLFQPLADNASAKSPLLFPILVYYHGGSFLSGRATTKAAALSRDRGVIVAAPQYRLGVFGFFNDSNLGLLDQRFALDWLAANAAAFSGDAARIGLVGCSAGGASIVHFLLTGGPFRTAAIESTGGHQGWMADLVRTDDDFMSYEIRSNNTRWLLDTLNCSSSLAAIRDVDATTLYAYASQRRFAPALRSSSNDEDAYPLSMLRAGDWARRTNATILVGGQSCESCADAAGYLGPPSGNVTDDELRAALVAAGFDEVVGVDELLRWYAERRRREGNWRAFARILSDSGHACSAALTFRAIAATSRRPVFRYLFDYTGSDPEYPGATHCSLEDWIWGYGSDHAGTPLSDALGAWWTALVAADDVNAASSNVSSTIKTAGGRPPAFTAMATNEGDLPLWPPSKTDADAVMLLGVGDDMTPRLGRSVPDTVRPECDHWKQYLGW